MVTYQYTFKKPSISGQTGIVVVGKVRITEE